MDGERKREREKEREKKYGIKDGAQRSEPA